MHTAIQIRPDQVNIHPLFEELEELENFIILPSSQSPGFAYDSVSGFLDTVQDAATCYNYPDEQIKDDREYLAVFRIFDFCTDHELLALKSIFSEIGQGRGLEFPPTICAALSLLDGSKWNFKTFYGYSQSDFCTVLYREDCFRMDTVCFLAEAWLGMVSEFEIDGERGYFLQDSTVWNEIACRYELESYVDFEELEIMLYDGEIRSPRYRKVF
jgi:hypothetical protein